MEKPKIALTSLSLALLLVTVILVRHGTAAPIVRTAGVTDGDFFIYGNVSFYLSSNDPNMQLPTGFENMNDTQDITLTVDSVVNTNITCDLLFHFKNGSTTDISGWVDVDTGDNVNMTLWFISANLVANDTLYSGGFYQTWTINQTIPKEYPNGPRDTNYLNITQSFSAFNNSAYQSYEVYWDKATGVMVQMSIIMSNTYVIDQAQYATYWSLLIQMTGSSLWTVPEFDGLAQTLILLASLTIVTVATTQKMRKKTRTDNRLSCL